MHSRPIIIGSRGSDLALYQANLVKDELSARAGVGAEVKIIRTQGDRVADLPLDKLEGKGFFTKELEEGLLDGSIDIAVHSLKDLPTQQPTGLKIAAVGFRADRREMLLVRPDALDRSAGPLPVRSGGRIGTSAARRKAQIAHLNSGLKIVDLRGNVPTRVGKLREGQYDAILIAAAGLERLRLDLTDLIAVPLDPEQFLPAPAQGILGIQVRGEDGAIIESVAKLNSREAEIEVALERGLLAKFDGGCSLPLGVFSEAGSDKYRLLAGLGTIGNPLSGDLVRAEAVGADPAHVVDEVYRLLTGKH
jgi:hydroxymethylbilane synthase